MKFSLALVLAALCPLVRGETPSVPADEAVTRLTQGNWRYLHEEMSHCHQDATRRNDTATSQSPFATILTCSDSRVAPEVVFDQGLGDLFVIRVAGNLSGVDETASIDYCTAHLGSNLIVVMGHQGCGAVKAAVAGGKLEGDLVSLVAAITPAVERAKQAGPDLTGNPLLSAAVEANVWLSIENLFHRSETVRSHVAGGTLKVVGAVYDIATGEVKWLGAHPQQDRLLAPIPAAAH